MQDSAKLIRYTTAGADQENPFPRFSKKEKPIFYENIFAIWIRFMSI